MMLTPTGFSIRNHGRKVSAVLAVTASLVGLAAIVSPTASATERIDCLSLTRPYERVRILDANNDEYCFADPGEVRAELAEINAGGGVWSISTGNNCVEITLGGTTHQYGKNEFAYGYDQRIDALRLYHC